MTAARQGLSRQLRRLGTSARASQEKRYLKSSLRHFGVTVPDVRRVARAHAREHPELSGAALWELVDELWSAGVHELRSCAVELLVVREPELTADDLPRLLDLIRTANTWALVDPLATGVVGPVVQRAAHTARYLSRWVKDEDFWVRRTALLAELLPLRRGAGDLPRFLRHAERLLDDREFFVQKAIGWVLRETGKQRPQEVATWVTRHATELSAVAFREAIKPLPVATRNRLSQRRPSRNAAARR